LAKASNNPFVRYLDSTMRRMPFSGYGAADEANQAAFNRNVNSTFGQTGDKVMPETISNAYDKIGGVFNDVGARTSVKIDNQALTAMAAAEQRAMDAGLDSSATNAIRA